MSYIIDDDSILLIENQKCKLRDKRA